MKKETREWMIEVGGDPLTLERVESDMRTNSINFKIDELEELDGIPAERVEENIVSYLCSMAKDDDKTYETAINTIQRTLAAVVGAVIIKNAEP